MDQAVDNLALALESEGKNQPKQIIDALACLAQASRECPTEEVASYELDELLADSFEKTPAEDHRRLVEMLPDLVSCMRDQRNIYPAIERYFEPECSFSIDVAKVVFIMKKDFGFEFDNFFPNLFSCIVPANIEDGIERKLLFILVALEDKSIPLSTIRAFVKKLCSVSLQVGSLSCHKILWTVLWIMRHHPMAYAMARNESFRKDLEWDLSITMERFQPYLFELDMLRESLKGIKKVVSLIRREAKDASARPKILTLFSFMFPELEI